MASDIMAEIIDTERLCDEMLAAANSKAESIVKEAEKTAAGIIEREAVKARGLAAQTLTKAEEDAKKRTAAAAERAAAKTEELRAASRSRESAAVLAVSKKLLELS